MLRTLYIRDYALIEQLDVEFDSGLNILTGETGAGKSIIVGALKMILGERASMDVVRTGSRKAIIEGSFDEVDLPKLRRLLEAHQIESQSCLILRREIDRSHSRAFINDTPATLPLMREVASQLIDLHGQHEHQSLLRTETHLELLDSFGSLGGLLADYQRQHARTRDLFEKRAGIVGRQGLLQERKDRLGFEIGEIDEVRLEPKEEEGLEDERSRLENAERLYSATAALYDLLYAREGATGDQLIVARNELQAIVRIDRAFENVFEEIRSAQIVVAEIAAFLQDYNARIEFNPVRLEAIRARLSELDRLKRKYGGTVLAVIDYRARIGAEYDLAANFEASLQELDAEIQTAQELLSRAALRLSEKRHEVADRIEGAIAAEMARLGMENSRLEVCFARREAPDGWITLPAANRKPLRFKALKNGMDEVEFFVSTNIGEQPKRLSRIASGGEISRIMLALKTILAKTDSLPILVFDEIDNGISGAIARKVGESMGDLARYHQIIAITHLPQIAALGQAHFVVEKHIGKERTRTEIRRIEDEERAEYLAMLITGADVTEATRESARELMAAGGSPP